MIEVYNFLDGKNLCNIFASLIVEKINESFPDAETEITVINVRNFFVIKGRTNSDVVINCSDLLKNFIKDYDNSIICNVIDNILYGTKVENNVINISYSSNKKINNRCKNIQNYLNTLRKENISINLKFDDINKYVFYHSNYDKINTLESLSNIFSDYYFINVDLSNEVYVSDRYYGLSNNTEKLYHVLLRNITHHLFSTGISSELEIKLFSDKTIYEMDNLNVVLDIKGKHIVKKEWLESLILDIFPFEYNNLKSIFNGVNNISYNEILTNYEICSWKKLDRLKDMVLV